MSEDGQLISFPLPEALEHEKIYKLELVRSNSVSKAEKILYSIFFRVSMYNTLKEKLDDSEIKCGWVDHKINDSRGYLIIKSAQLKNIELFDPFETENIQCISGFIGVWYDNYVFALIYEYAKELQELGLVYPSTESGYNVPPLNAAYIKQNHYYSSNSLENNIVKFPEEAYVVNNGHEMFYYDYRAVSSFIYRLKNDPDFIVPEGLIEYFDYVYNHGYGGYGTEDFSVTLQYFIPAFDYYGTEKTIWVDR